MTISIIKDETPSIGNINPDNKSKSPDKDTAAKVAVISELNKYPIAMPKKTKNRVIRIIIIIIGKNPAIICDKKNIIVMIIITISCTAIIRRADIPVPKKKTRSFVGVIKTFLSTMATERINNQNVLLYISQCTTVEQLYDICNAFIAPIFPIKWYILTTTF